MGCEGGNGVWGEVAQGSKVLPENVIGINHVQDQRRFGALALGCFVGFCFCFVWGGGLFVLGGSQPSGSLLFSWFSGWVSEFTPKRKSLLADLSTDGPEFVSLGGVEFVFLKDEWAALTEQCPSYFDLMLKCLGPESISLRSAFLSFFGETLFCST